MTVLSGEGSLSKASLIEDMSSEGFKCYETSLGGDGVLWHDGGVPSEFGVPSSEGVGVGVGVEAASKRSGQLNERLGSEDTKGLGAVALRFAAATAALGVIFSVSMLGLFPRR